MSKDPVTKDQNKAKAIDMALGQIEKQFGKGAIMRLGEEGALIPDLPDDPDRLYQLGHCPGAGRNSARKGY